MGFTVTAQNLISKRNKPRLNLKNDYSAKIFQIAITGGQVHKSTQIF